MGSLPRIILSWWSSVGPLRIASGGECQKASRRLGAGVGRGVGRPVIGSLHMRVGGQLSNVFDYFCGIRGFLLISSPGG